MGSMSFTTMQTELQRRVQQLGATDAGSAINRAIRWTNSLGAYSFQLQTPTTLAVTSTGNIAAPADFDPGKPCYCANPNGTPIRFGPPTDVWETQGLNTIVDSGFDRFYIQVGATTTHTLYFWPVQTGTTTVTFIYHKITADIAGATTSNLPRDFDDLIIDLAEAEESRIFDKGEVWAGLLQRSQERTKSLLDAYRSERIATGLSSENAAVVQEKTSVGRG